MAMLCALDWRCFLVNPTLTEDPNVEMLHVAHSMT
jgi:hypothetical protein